MSAENSSIDASVINNVMQPSAAAATEKLANSAETYEIKGYDLNNGIDYEKILSAYKTTGFQATNFSKAVDEINRMVTTIKIFFHYFKLIMNCFLFSLKIKCKLTEMPEDRKGGQVKTNCTIFLGYTSNMISCGMREYIRFLVQHKMIDCIVSTAGGIEEDFIKCLAPTVSGDFHLSGTQLRNEGINRIGNLLIPNDNYCKFEDWIMPIFDQMVDEQIKDGVNWTPSKIINRLGKEINNPESVYYWAYKVNIQIFYFWPNT